MRYNVVQTGAKSHDGGLRAGFSSVAYHVETDDAVKKEPMPPASVQITKEMRSFEVVSNFIRGIMKKEIDLQYIEKWMAK